MEKTYFEKTLTEYMLKSPESRVKKEAALRPDLEGMPLFDEPLFGYASAKDSYFIEAKKPEVIGDHFLTPEEWLKGAKTVIAIFFRFSARIREANRSDMIWPADEWMQARIDGQAFMIQVCRYAVDLLEKEGFTAMIPMFDSRFSSKSPVTNDKTKDAFYTSNWSERHAAYAAGLGTFGLSKGLISRNGVAGRYLSVITAAPFEPDKRPYSGVYDYCNNCGLCISNCPVAAITKEEGKRHYPCSEFVDSTEEKHSPYYGCGKCQVKVPCESKAPNAGNFVASA